MTAETATPALLTAAGKRLIVGEDEQARPKEGVGLVVRAAEAGEPEALALLAVFHALGMYLRQSWRHALNCLRLAAELEWEPARAQLRVLASDRALAAREDGGGDHWLKLAGTVDLGYWHGAPPGETLNERPLIRRYPGLLDEAACRFLIDKARGRLSRARVYDSVTRETTTSHTRTNSSAVFNLVDTDVLNILLQMRMSACTGLPFRHFEAATVLHYAPGQQISEHFDFIDPASPNYEPQIARTGQRAVTFLVYLNDDYSGGETAFPELGIVHRGVRGEGLFFVNVLPDGSPDRRTLHAGRPTGAGEKWLVSQFIRDRAFF